LEYARVFHSSTGLPIKHGNAIHIERKPDIKVGLKIDSARPEIIAIAKSSSGKYYQRIESLAFWRSLERNWLSQVRSGEL
jgi:hypothetical protein